MTTMIADFDDAFISAEKSEDKAQAIVDYDSKFPRLEADLRVLQWMTGAIVAGVVSLVVKAFIVV